MLSKPLSGLIFLLLASCGTTTTHFDYIAPSDKNDLSFKVLEEKRPLKFGFILMHGGRFPRSVPLFTSALKKFGLLNYGTILTGNEYSLNRLDVIIRFKIHPGGFSSEDTAEAVSTYTQQSLFKITATGPLAGRLGQGRIGNLVTAVKEEINRDFLPGLRLFRKVASQRLIYEEQAPPQNLANSHPQNNALSSKNIATIVKETVSAISPNTNTSHIKKFNTTVDIPSYKERMHPQDLALIIGIEKYSGSIPKAVFAKRDAQAVLQHIQALGVPLHHIKRLTDEVATRGRIRSAMTWLKRNTKPSSTIYFYYSGHGSPGPKGTAYLVPFDGDPSDLAETAFPVSTLYQDLNSLPAKKIIVVLDACFTGEGKRSVLGAGVRPLVTKIKEGSVPDTGKLVVFTAARSDQESGVLDSKGHGLFTFYFLKGLNGAAERNKHVTVKDLFLYLKPRVQDEARLDNRTQTPELEPILTNTIALVKVR